MSISFSGLASGLDTSSWVTSLTQLRQAKITTLETQKTSIATAQSTLQGIRSFFASFRSSIEKITDSKFNVSSMDIFSKKIATVSNAAVLSATAKSNAAEGSYEVKVKNTATQTQVKSGYRYKTTLISTTQATTSSLLKNIGIGYGNNVEVGITTGDIEIDHNNVTSRISISANETMSTFLDKLHNAGINADFNNETGIFSIDVNRGDIRDIGNTNILNKLNITDINFGYTGNQLKIEESHEEYHQATTSTHLSELGVNTGTLTITTANGTYEVTLDDDDTIGSLVNALRGEGIEATFNEGVFSIDNAYISDDGTTGLIQHFGLSTPAIASQSQESGGLKYQTVYTQTTTAHLDSYLKDIDGVNLTGDQTIVVKNASGVTSTITVGTSTTIGGMVNSMNAAGVNLNASFNESTGTLSIQNGWIIEGGTFDVEAAFGLVYTGVPATITGDALTVTTTTVTGATGATKLKDLTTAVTSGTIKVTDTSGNAHNLVVSENDTIDQFAAKVRAFGLGASFDDTTGTLTLVGGSYTTDGIAAGNRSNILSVFFGSDTLTPSAIDSASSTSQSLREAAVTTYAATGTTTLNQLGMNNATYTATFKTGTTEVNVQINGSMNLSGLVSALRTQGVDAEFNADTQRIMITDGEFIGVSGGNFGTIMNFSSIVTGRYATSDTVMAQNITVGVEMTSSGAVYYTVDSTNTITNVVTTTTPITSSSAPLTYQTVTTTTTAGTAGIEVTGASAITYESVSTAGTSQTTGTLSYITTTTTPGSTTTVGSTLTSGSLYEPSTTATSNTSGTLTYNSVTPGSSYMETLGVDMTGSTLYVTTTAGSDITTGNLSYESVTYGSTSISTVGQSVTSGVVYVTTTAAAQQSSDTLTYQSVTQGSTSLSTTGLSTTSGVMYVTTTVAKSQTTGVLTYEDITSGVATTSTVGIEMTGTSVIIGSTSPIEQTGSTLTYSTVITSVSESTTQGIDNTYITTLSYETTVTSNTGDTTTGITTTLQSGVLTYTTSVAAGTSVYVLGTTGAYRSAAVGQTQSGVAFQSTALVTLTNGTTASSGNRLSSLGITQAQTIKVTSSDGLTSTTISITSTSYVSTVVSRLNSAGLTASFTNGYLYVEASDSCYISAMSAQLRAKFQLPSVDAMHQSTGTIYSAVTEDTRLNTAITYNGGSSGNGQQTQGNGHVYTLTTKGGATYKFALSDPEIPGSNISTIGNVIDKLQELGYSAGVKDGKVWFSPEEGMNPNNAVESMSDDLKTALGITNLGNNNTYITGKVDSTLSAISSNLALTISGTVSVTSTLASLGYEDSMVFVKTNGQSLTITSSTTLSNALKSLVNFGLAYYNGSSWTNSASGVPSSGTISTNVCLGQYSGAVWALAKVYNIETSGDTVDSGVLINPDRVGYGRTYTYSSSKTVTYTASVTKTLANVGLVADGEIITSNGTVTVHSTDTINTFVNNLNAKLGSGAASYSSSTGRLTISNTASKYIIDATGDEPNRGDRFGQNEGSLASWLNGIGINFGEGVTYNVSGGNTVTTTTQQTATTGTSLSALGLTSSGTLTNHNGIVYTINPTDTVDDLKEKLQAAHLSASFENLTGEFTTEQNSAYYITSMSQNLRNLLGITNVGEGYTYTTIEGGTITTTSTATATTATTLATLGFTGSGTITFGDGTTATLTGSSTINDFLTCSNYHNLQAGWDEDGYIHISPLPGNNYIANMTPGLAQALGLQLGEGHMYETSGVTIDRGTTLGDLGLMGSSYFIETDDDMLYFDTDSTIRDIMEALINTGNSDALLDDGILTIVPRNGHYVVSIDSALRAALGLDNPGEGVSYVIHTEAAQSTTATVTATTETTLNKLGLNADAIVRLSNGESITLNGSNTIGDLQSFLTFNGVSFNISDGSITVGNANDSNYITYSDLSTILGIRAGAGDSYNVSSRAAIGTDKLATLGFTGEYSIVTNHTTVLRTATADTTLNDLIGVLQNNAGLTASLSNGTLTIAPNNGHYLMDMTSDLATKLGNIRYGLGDSYNIDIQTTASNTETITATESTTLGQLGLNGSAVVVINGTYSITFNPNHTIDNVCQELGQGIFTDFSDGVLTVGSPEDDDIITYSELGSIIGIRAGNGYSYNTSSRTLQASDTLSSLGLTGNYTIKTDNNTIALTGSSTLTNIITSLTAAGTGLGASLSGGQLTITAQNGHYVTDMSPDLASALNLQVGNGYSYNIDIETSDPSTSTVQATGATTLGQLGMNGNSYILNFSNGASYTFNSSSTLSSVTSALMENGYSVNGVTSGAVTINGGMTIHPTGTTYITYSDLTDLGIRAGEGYSYNTNIANANGNTTFASLGLASGNYTVNMVVSETVPVSFTIGANNTINNFVSSFNTACGSNLCTLQTSGSNCYLTFDDSVAITGMDPSLASILGIQIGEGSSYTTNLVYNEPTTVTHNATTGTTMAQLGMGQTGYISVSNGSVVTVQTSDTINTVISKLASVGITATLDTGKFTIGRNTDTNYVTNMSSWVSTALGVEAGEGYTYNSHNVSATANSTLASLGMQGDSAVIKTDIATITVDSTTTVQQLINTLNAATTGLSASLNNGVLTIGPSNGHYLYSMSSNLSILLGMETGYGESYGVNIVEEGVTTNTINATTSTQLSQIGLNGNYVVGLNNGNSVTLTGANTLGNLKTFLDSNGVTFSISNGQITVGATNNTNYITYSDLSGIGIRAGEGKSFNSSTSTINATTATALSTLGLASGQDFYIRTDGGTITVNSTNTIGNIITALSAKGLNASLNGQNKLKITPTGGHYIESMSADLASVLGSIDTGLNISYRIVDEVTNTATATATAETTFGVLGLTNSGFLLTNDGRTVTAEVGDTISSFRTKLSNVGVSSSYNASTGIFTIGNSGDTNFVTGISQNLQAVLGNVLIGENATYTVGTHEEYEYETIHTPTTITTDQTFGDIGVTQQSVLSLSNGQSVTVNSSTTIGSFLSDISSKGITATLSNGLVNLKPQGSTYITGYTGQNILAELNMVGTPYSVSDGTLANAKLKDLVDGSGMALGITSGNIKVYKNGIASTIAIDNNTTLEDLATRLSNYNIQMVYSSGNNGKIYFTSTGDSYLSEVSGGTNLLTALGASTWTANKATSSQSLEYEVGSNEVISGDTKLVNLKNSSGTSLGITAGKYKIKAAGISYEGTITATTSVNDFFTDIARYGITGSINSDGQITLNTSNDDTYLEKANGASGYSNVVDTLFPSWTFGNIYISNNMDVTTVTTVNMTSETKLSDIDQGTYKAGKVVISNRNTGDTVIELAPDATVGDFMAALSYHGFNAYIENGRLIARNDGYTTLKNYSVPSQASNVLDLLGFDNTSAWEQPGYYSGATQTATTYHTVLEAATRETKLSNLRDASGTSLGITTGKYVAYSNGVAHTVNLSSTDITLDSFMNTLAGFGISTIFDTQDGQSVLKLVGSGDSYVTSASGPDASNVIQKLFGNGAPSTLYNYQGYEQTTEIVSTTVIATLGTSLSDYDHGNVKSEGIFALTVDGVYSEINITSYETFGSLLEKFERAGVQASLTDGVLRLETGNKTFVVDEENTTSNLIANLGLYYSNNLGGFAASAAPVTQTTTTIEDRTLSVAKYADYNTQLGLLNISSGTLSIYRNGAKQLITIDNTETFSQLRARIRDAFGDVDIDFNKGKLRFFSTTEGIDVQVGSSNDTSNMSSICGFSQDEDGYIVSARELYKVNASSVITTSDLFRYGDVTEGTFIIGDETFTITSATTIQNIVSQINSSEKANASAYWDSVDGKLVISSRSTGASMVNIEAGTSNFTDILGLTASEWNNDGSVKVTRIKLESQELGNNASFSINGTNFQSASNVITSDVSRIQGLTINLKSASAGDTVTITVGKDAEAVTEAVGEFVEAYNDLVDNVDTELASGVLKDQSTLKFIRQQIRNLLINTFSGATTFRNLAALGISTSAGNSVTGGDVSAAGIEYLYFDTEKFLEGYNKDPDAVKNMLVGTDNAPGILLQIENIVENALATGTGYFSVADKSYSDKITSINEKIKKANQAIEAYRARLESKFQSMDLLISQMQNQYNSFLSGSATSAVTSYFS